MSCDAYALHIIQKLKLAVSIAIIKTKPDNITTEEHISELKTKITNKMDIDDVDDLSICSDDFNLDSNQSLEKDCSNANDVTLNTGNSITNNNAPKTTLVPNNVHENNKNSNAKSKKPNKLNNIANVMKNNRPTTVNNNKTHKNIHNNNATGNNSEHYYKTNPDYQINDIKIPTNNNKDNTLNKNDDSIIDNEIIMYNDNHNTQDYYNIIFDNDNIVINERDEATKNVNRIIDNEIIMYNDNHNTQDYYNIIFDNDDIVINKRDEVNESPTILKDFETLLKENFMESSIKFVEDSVVGNDNTFAHNENLSQDVFQTQAMNSTLYSEDHTYCLTADYIDESTINTQNNKLTDNPDENDTKQNEITTENHLKHIIDFEEDKPNTKRRKNVEAQRDIAKVKSKTDPNDKFKRNITKFLVNNNMAAQKTNPNENTDKTKLKKYNIQLENPFEDTKIEVKEKPTVTNTIATTNEFTQNSTHYSQSQPVFLIDNKYIYNNKANNIVKNDTNSKNDFKNGSYNNHHNKEIRDELENKSKPINMKTDIQTNASVKIALERDVNTNNNDFEIARRNENKTVIKKTELNYQKEIYLFTQNSQSTNNIDFTNDYTQEITEYYLNDNHIVTPNNVKPTEIYTENDFNDIKANTASSINNKFNETNHNHKEIRSVLQQNTKFRNGPATTKDALKENEAKHFNNIQITLSNNKKSEETILNNEDIRAILTNNIDNKPITLTNGDLKQIQVQKNSNDIQETPSICKKSKETCLNNEETRAISPKYTNFGHDPATNTEDFKQTKPKIPHNILNTNKNDLETDINDSPSQNTITELTQSFNNLPKASQEYQIQRQNSNSSDIVEEVDEEIIPFKIIEELNKIKNYLNKSDCKSIEGSQSDTGYKTDSQSKSSYKSSQSNLWLNQSAHSLFTYLLTCPLIHNTEDITREISNVLGQLIDKLHENEQYPSFLEEVLEATDLLIKLIYEENFDENQLIKIDDNVQRIILLTKSRHIQKYAIEKITSALENLQTILTKDSLQEIESIQKIENSCYLFHILYLTLQNYKKNLEKDLDSQKTQKTDYYSQNSSQNTQNSQDSVKIKKTDICDIWRRKWNANSKEESKDNDVERKCALTQCNKVLNSIIVNCMDGHSLVAYFALKCFNVIQT